MRLLQSSLAERMRQLGWKRWHPQTVSEVEAGRRDLRADELLGLAIALETTINVLTMAPLDVGAVKLPNGTLVGSRRLYDMADGTTSWDGDRPEITRPSGVPPVIDAQLAGRREELRRLEDYVAEVRRQAVGEAPLSEPEPGDLDAHDRPPRSR